MAFLSGLFSLAGAVNQVMKFVNWARSRLELAGAYVAGYLRAQKVHEEAHEDEIEATHDDARDVEDMTDEELDDLLGGPDESDGVLNTDGVAGDTKSGDNPKHKV